LYENVSFFYSQPDWISGTENCCFLANWAAYRAWQQRETDASGSNPAGKAWQVAQYESTTRPEGTAYRFDGEITHPAMAGGIEHLRHLQGSSNSDCECENLPTMPRVTHCEKEPEEREGANPLKGHGHTRWVWAILDRADCNEGECSQKNPAEDACRFGHRSRSG
jgi:hypothetical protein